MAWVKIDDQFYDHPRWATAPGDSIALWLAAMAWCNRNDSRTGFIPDAKTRGLLTLKRVEKVCADLCAREAFTKVDGGFLIRNYAEYQQPDKVQAIRDKRAASGKRGAARRWGEHHRAAEAGEAPPPPEPPPIEMAFAMANAMANAMAKTCPVTRIPETRLKTSSSSLTSVAPLPSEEEEDQAFRQVIDIIAQQRLDDRDGPNPIGNPTAWLTTTRNSITTRYSTHIRRQLATGATPTETAGTLIDPSQARTIARRLGILNDEASA